MTTDQQQTHSLSNIDVVILAAGDSTRMRSTTPKVLHQLAGRPLIEYSVQLATALSSKPPVVVVGRDADKVQAALGDRARYVQQAQRLGTGHAVMQARPLLAGESQTTLVFYADMPLVTETSMRALLEIHARSASSGGVLSMLTFESTNPRGFGRIVRSTTDDVLAIVEEADCTAEQAKLTELNPGLYCYRADWLWENLDHIPISAKGEYYLTDLVSIAASQGHRVVAERVEDATEMLGINTRAHLAEAETILRQRINRCWMEAGVTLLDPATTYIDDTVMLGRDTILHPSTHLRGATSVGDGCEIGPNTSIENTTLGRNCVVRYSVLEQATIEDDVDIGPFAHLRKGAHLAQGVHMGNFGEIKNSYLGPGTKMGHFSYLGDATVGRDVNIGAGTITCNFDGVNKHPTVIADGAFVGSDTLLVAPVTLGEGARTGAGSVVTHDVAAGELVFGVPARPRLRSDAPQA